MAARRRPSPLSGEWLRLRWVRRGERGRLRAALLRPTGEGMAERLGLRGEGRGGIYTGPMPGRPHLPGRARAVTVGRTAGPSTARTSCRAGTGTPPAVPGRARAVPRRAGPRAVRRAGPKWTCIVLPMVKDQCTLERSTATGHIYINILLQQQLPFIN